MKKLFTLMIAFLSTLIMAQAPESFNYQAVVRDANGNVLPNTQVTFQFDILSGSATGTLVYSEQHEVTTNQYGLVNLKIGEGNVLSGDFSSIDWGGNTYFLNIKLDQGGGFEDLGTQQFVSVPYALYAKTAGNGGGTTYTAGNGISITGNVIENTAPDQEVTITGTGATTVSGTYPNFTISTDNSMNGDVTGTTTNNTVTKIQGQDVSINPPATGQVLKWNGTEWAPGDDNTTGGSGVDGVVDGASFSGTTTKTLTLSRSNGLPPITANFTDEVDDADSDPTNEIQTINKSSSTVTLSNGGGSFTDEVNDADADPSNELQVLNMSNDTLYLSNGGQVYLGNYTNYWTRHGNDIYYNSGHVGVGTDAPGGPLVVKADTSLDPDSALFEVKNKNGQTIFAVYDGGVRVYVSEDTTYNKDNVRTHKMGFAVGGLVEEKITDAEYFRVTPDSVRVWIKDDDNRGGGFAVAGYSANKTTSDYFMNINSGDTANIINPSEARVLWYPTKNAFFTGQVLVESPDSVGENSWATGYESKSIGRYSQALGYKPRAYGENSTAIGYYANSEGTNSYAFGNYALAQDSGSYAIGSGAQATGVRSFAIGSTGIDSSGVATNPTIASGDYSYAFGMGAEAEGKGSFAIGTNTNSRGSYSLAVGYGAVSSSTNGLAIGKNCTAGNSSLGFPGYSLALGFGSKAYSEAMIISGYYIPFSAIAIGNNAYVDAHNSYAIGNNISVTGNYSFGINFGSSSYTLSQNNSMAIMGGNVGIGTVSPNSTLHVNAPSGDDAFRVQINGSTKFLVSSNGGASVGNNVTAPSRGLYVYGQTSIGTSSPASYTKFQVNTNDASGYAAYFFNDGNNNDRWGIRIQAGMDDHSGNNYMIRCFDGDDDYEGALIIDDGVLELVQNSDKTLKKNIFDTKYNASNIIRKLRVVDYSYKQGRIGAIETGFVAQELQKVFPQMVIRDPETQKLGIMPLKLIPILTKANQEQQKRIDDLLERIERLEKIIEQK